VFALLGSRFLVRVQVRFVRPAAGALTLERRSGNTEHRTAEPNVNTNCAASSQKGEHSVHTAIGLWLI
jgi:hypothetical protein